MGLPAGSGRSEGDQPGPTAHPPYVASESPSTAAKSEASRTAAEGSSSDTEILTPGADSSRNRAPAAIHQPYDRSPLTTADSSRTGTHRFIRLAQAAQRSLGPLAVTAALATGPLGWTAFGTAIALTCGIQHRLVRDRIHRTPLSVASVTVSEH